MNHCTYCQGNLLKLPSNYHQGPDFFRCLPCRTTFYQNKICISTFYKGRTYVITLRHANNTTVIGTAKEPFMIRLDTLADISPQNVQKKLPTYLLFS